jgi:hypothetical protein
VRDGVIRHAIGSWLKAGVLEDGFLSFSEQGTPQGGVVSPILANIVLHHVLDVWFEDEIRPRLSSKSFLVRYADDAVIVVKNEDDARRVMDVLPKRFEKYGLTLHPDKTRLVRFERYVRRREGKDRDDDDDMPSTFSFLGFTHFWGESRWGRSIKTATEGKRLRRTLRAISEWCATFRHLPIAEQHFELSRKLIGHDGYYGVSGNGRALSALRHWTRRIWRYWLNRRSQKRPMSWVAFANLMTRFPLPKPQLDKHLIAATAKP